MKDTIFALSTLAGKSGISVIRISGVMALTTLESFGFKKLPSPNHAYFSKVIDPTNGELIDEGMIIYFKAPHSFTGEDIVEFQLHGSLAVINDMIIALSQLDYLRLAEPGEFSKRAFMNGKLDLTKAEGLALLIDAETSVQRKIALNQMQGGLEILYEAWRKKLISVLARIEAYIDFPEDDIPLSALQQAQSSIDELITDINKHLADNQRGEVITRGINIAIIGAPNVGKSTLLNNIAKKEVAIVSNIPGTTRDVIEVRVNLKGYAVTFSDTAGIRNTKNVIEIEGVAKSLKTLENADIAIFIFEANTLIDFTLYKDYMKQSKQAIILLNKIDLTSDPYIQENDTVNMINHLGLKASNVIGISATKGIGVDKLLDALAKMIQEQFTLSSEPLITKARYRTALQKCVKHLFDFDIKKSLEIAAEDIRIATYHLGSITGRVEIDEILDEIFSNFCIGK